MAFQRRPYAQCRELYTTLSALTNTLLPSVGAVYRDMDVECIECFPEDNVEMDPGAVGRALATMARGDICIVFTPDDTHFDIAKAAISLGLHVLMAKPLVKKLSQHQELALLASAAGVMVRRSPCGLQG